MKRYAMLLAAAVVLLASSAVIGQTTAGTSAIIVVPVIAQTASFASEVTVYNPNASTISVTSTFYDAQNTASPGPKACTSFSVGANVTRSFTVAAQCALPSGSNFGLLVLSEATGTQRFYGYARTQTPQGIGFSTEGFPIENFNDQIQHVTGLKRVAASGGLPAYQTNCFVATLADAVSYELRLFDGGTNTQLGSTLSGSLAGFQQFRYLDVFAAAGVAAGNKTNVRAQFTNLTGNNKKLIGFCTVQEDTNFSADFRIAKSYGGTPQNAFVQGGNGFGTGALIGTTDNQPFTVLVDNQPSLRISSAAPGVINVINGAPVNSVGPAVIGATIGGGGGTAAGANIASGNFVSIGGGANNQAGGEGAVIGGGVANIASQMRSTVGGGDTNTASGLAATIAGGQDNAASGDDATVGGGGSNVASGQSATVSGGQYNSASGFGSTVAGGESNSASGSDAIVAGGSGNTASGVASLAGGVGANANTDGCMLFVFWIGGSGADCFGTQYQFRIMGSHGLSVDYGTRLPGGNGTRWAVIGDTLAGKTIATWTNAYLADGGTWVNASDRDLKTDFQAIDPLRILAKVDAMPVTHWRYKNQIDEQHLGPVAQDFYAAFGLGADDKHIATVDEAGVALAAIQGLHRVMLEKDAKIETQQQAIAEQRHEITELRTELDALKRAVAQLTRNDGPVAMRASR